MSGNPIAIVSPPGEVRLNLEETLYNFGFWGSVSFDRIYAKALVELAPTENANILVTTDNFSEFNPEEPWKNELEREDYSLTVGFDAGYGFSLFGGYKYTRFQANGLGYNFILGSKDTRYEEEGIFLGGSYEWVFDNRMSMAISVAYAFLDLEIAASTIKLLQPNLFDSLNKHGTAAVHDRHFRAVDFNDDIVDTHTEERGHEVFDGRNPVFGRIAENRAERCRRNLVPESGNFCGAVLVGAHENDTDTGIGRNKCNRRRFARMNADSRQGYLLGKRRLSVNMCGH